MTSGDSNNYHFVDFDLTPDSKHHTLGIGSTQASPGDHDHSGGLRGLYIPQSAVTNLDTALAGKADDYHTHSVTNIGSYDDIGNPSAFIGADLFDRFKQKSEGNTPSTSGLTNCTTATGTLVQPDGTHQAAMYACQVAYTLTASAATASGTITIPTGLFFSTPIYFITARISISASVRVVSPTSTQVSWGLYVPTVSGSALAFFINLLAVGIEYI